MILLKGDDPMCKITNIFILILITILYFSSTIAETPSQNSEDKAFRKIIAQQAEEINELKQKVYALDRDLRNVIRQMHNLKAKDIDLKDIIEEMQKELDKINKTINTFHFPPPPPR